MYQYLTIKVPSYTIKEGTTNFSRPNDYDI